MTSEAKNTPTWRSKLTQEQLSVIEDLRQKRETMLATIPANRGQRLEKTLKATREQPLAITATLQEEGANIASIARSIASRDVTRLICLGCGDSYFVPLSIRLAYEQLVGRPFEAVQALEFGRYYHRLTSPSTPVIALSSSGVVPRTLEAMWVAKAAGAFTVAVTNRPGSPLDEAADQSITVRAGRPGPPTQSSTAAMAALLLLALDLAGELGSTSTVELNARRAELQNLPQIMAGVIEAADEPMRQVAHHLRTATHFNFVGAGPSLGTAHFGYAKVREASWDHSMPWQSEEYDHEVTFQLPEGEPVFLVAPQDASYDRNVEIARAVRRDRGYLVSIVTEGDTEVAALSDVVITIPLISEYFTPLIYVVPLQFFGIYLGIAKAPYRAEDVPSHELNPWSGTGS